MFDLLMHARMLADAPRARAYEDAIASVVRPGDVVIDLGTGTGIHAVLACRSGARTVYAIEASPIINLAHEIATANGVADRVVFLPQESRSVTLPERADVLIADIRGVLPYFGTALVAMMDARDRMLRPGARMIPLRDTTRAALVEAPSTALLHRTAWRHPVIDLSPGERRAAHATHKHLFEPSEIVSDIATVADLDYETMRTPDLETAVTFTVTRNARLSGLALWFDSILSPAVTMTNAPGADPLLYGQLFVPFESDLPVRTGEQVQVELSARLLPGSDDYLWRWRTAVRSGSAWKTVLDQSSFFAMPAAGGRRE